MKVTIEFTRPEILAAARVLQAEHIGAGYMPADSAHRDNVLIRLITSAALSHRIRSPAITAVIERDYRRFHKLPQRQEAEP